MLFAIVETGMEMIDFGKFNAIFENVVIRPYVGFGDVMRFGIRIRFILFTVSLYLIVVVIQADLLCLFVLY